MGSGDPHGRRVFLKFFQELSALWGSGGPSMRVPGTRWRIRKEGTKGCVQRQYEGRTYKVWSRNWETSNIFFCPDVMIHPKKVFKRCLHTQTRWIEVCTFQAHVHAQTRETSNHYWPLESEPLHKCAVGDGALSMYEAYTSLIFHRLSGLSRVVPIL